MRARPNKLMDQSAMASSWWAMRHYPNALQNPLMKYDGKDYQPNKVLKKG